MEASNKKNKKKKHEWNSANSTNVGNGYQSKWKKLKWLKQRNLPENPAELKFRFLRRECCCAAAGVSKIKGPHGAGSRLLRSEHWPTRIEVFKGQNKSGSKGIENCNMYSVAVAGIACHLQNEEVLPEWCS